MTLTLRFRKTLNSALLILAAGLGVSAAGTAPAALVASTNSWAEESPAQHDARMHWWREARFGLFIHWGLYSVAAGEWQGKTTTGAGEWLMNDLQVPLSEYAQLAPQFNPQGFDAQEWVSLAKAAGMKYIVITTKHHDGFGLYPSSLTDWCLKATPCQRDPLKELAHACQQEGIRLGFYHSIMDWHHPDYAPRKPWNDLASRPPDFDRYSTFLKGQLKELLSNYGPISVLWFDGQWENTWTYGRGAELYQYVRELQPGIIVNNRVSTEAPLQPGQRPWGDYKTPEQSIPSNGFGPGVDWETCMTMNNTWGYKQSDHDWKSTQVLVRNLVDCASKGGNYLLNIGPTGEGLIPEASVARLKQIGGWMKTNGEAIYATTASPFPRPLSWGRCTQKASANTTILYLHVFDWPKDRQLLLPGLRTPALSAWLLADPKKRPLPTETVENGLLLSLPETAPDEISSTLVLRLSGAAVVETPVIVQNRDGEVELRASEARLHGSTFQYECSGPLDDIGYWTTPEDWADWEFKLARPGKFAVSAVIAAPASGAFEISVAGQTLRCTSPRTADYLTFSNAPLGQLEIPAAGKVILAVRPIKNGWQPMNLKAIALKPVATPDRLNQGSYPP